MVQVSSKQVVFVLVLAALFLTIEASLPERAHAQSNVYIASLNQDIDPGAQDFVTSSINDASSLGIHNFILILNTNGGNGANMENIITAISNYESGRNNFTTLIAPKGAFSFSAGAYIAESSDKILMVPGTVIGSATPIVSGIPTGEENSTLTKDISAFAAYMATLTVDHGRNDTETRLMVTRGVSYACGSISNCEAYQPRYSKNVADGVLNANSTQQALTWMSQNGWAGADQSTIHTPGTSSLFLSIISDPNLDSILFLAGVFAILADLYHPTLVLTVVGAVLIALALLGLGVFGAPIVSIILMMIGAAFIFLELKIHHGVAAIAGVIIFVVGFLLIFSLPSSAPTPAGAPSGTFAGATVLTYTVLGIVGGGGVLGSIYLYRVRETLMHRPPAQNPKAIIGKKGHLTSDLTAGGVASANIASEDYTVTGPVDLPRGSPVTVKDIQGLRLVVEKEGNP